jgi:hypothetical protein
LVRRRQLHADISESVRHCDLFALSTANKTPR